jgi:hypothetical protein
MAMRTSNPLAYQTAATAALRAAVESLTAALTQFRQASNLQSSWTGVAQQAQQQRGNQLADAVTRVVAAMARAGTVTTTGAVQMQASKMQADATVTAALAGGFIVLPTGQVLPGPGHSGPQLPAYQAMARMYTAKINASMVQSTATDAQVAAALAKVAIEFLADLLKKQSGGSATGTMPSMTQPTMSIPTNAAAGSGLAGAGAGAPWSGGGTSLAGAGTGVASSLTGAGLPGGSGGIGLSGAGLGGPGLGATSLGGAGAGSVSPSLGTGIAMSTAGAASAGPGRVGTGPVGGALGRGTATTGGTMPLGGRGASGHADDEQPTSDTWLQEDENPWEPGDAPEGVLA